MDKDKQILDELVQINKPLLICAGPGMGKTYTLAYKIKNLVVTKGINPNKVSVITFTNEASINMRKKISSKSDKDVFIEQQLQPPAICTMHKLGNRIIKDYHLKLGLKINFQVLSSSYLKETLIKDCAQIIGFKRNDANATIECRGQGKCIAIDSLKCKICDEYKKLSRKFNCIDHDDQVLLACELLKNHKDILEKEQEKIEYLLVDEYQDINYAQWELIRLLSGEKGKNLFVVGDDYQSIYGFRGGSLEYIRNFKKDYAPDAEARKLTKCRRCPPNIFKGAFGMVQKYNGGDINLIKNLEFTENSDSRVKIYNFEHSNLEAAFIATNIKEIGPSHDVLILVPRISLSESIKRALRKRFVDFSCDYQVEETELYLISTLLKWLNDSSDNFNFRILIEEIIDRGISDIPGKQTEFTGKDKNKNIREEALKQISNIWKEVEKGKTLYSQIRKLRTQDMFKKLLDIVITLRASYSNKEDIVGFISTIVNKLATWKKIPNFENEIISIIEEIKSIGTKEHNVRILTLKKAKGLEADYVFIVGLENNLLPHILPDEPPNKEEDSRLLYVSMTRAKKELYLLHSKIRDRKITKVLTSGRSEFIEAIPKEYVEEHP